MKNALTILAVLLPLLATAQFSTVEQSELTVIVTDGTFESQHSPQRAAGDARYTDPIRSLGMQDALQAGAFTERPDFGVMGFLLVFCVNDSVGGKQGELEINGNTYYGIYRLIRQKLRSDEEVPEGMTSYRIKGTVFFLGIS
ncbi:MAG: hypothetical protein AAGJ82_09095 [Bacteroidota bacterium]